MASGDKRHGGEEPKQGRRECCWVWAAERAGFNLNKMGTSKLFSDGTTIQVVGSKWSTGREQR